MSVDVTPAFAAYFARNRGPTADDPDARLPPDYGLAASLDGDSVALTLTFRTGSAYCCAEWGCHADLLNGRRWSRLRDDFAAWGLAAPEPLRLRVTVVVEAGALFLDMLHPLPGPRRRYPLKPVAGWRYMIEVAEDGELGTGFDTIGVR